MDTRQNGPPPQPVALLVAMVTLSRVAATDRNSAHGAVTPAPAG
ncbi:hypothetical protein [Streptomyces cadmiisoli]